MKTKILAAMALVSTSFTPMSLMTAPALAANPTTSDMQTICNAHYVDGQADPTKWRATVTNATQVDGPRTQVVGSERNILYRPDTGSTFVYAAFLRADDPLTRTGGSVNMWGQTVFSQKIWDNTLYDVEADFMHTVTFHWTCDVDESVNQPVWVEDPPSGNACGNSNGNNNGGNLQEGGNGEGNNGCGNGNGGPTGTGTGGGAGTGGSGNNGNNNGGNLQTGGNGEGNNGCGNGNGGPTGTNENCGGNAGPTGHYEDHWVWVDSNEFPEELAGDNVDEGYSTIQSNVQQLGHVDGVNYTETGEFKPAGVRTLAGINPGKKGGTWTKKNGYTGVNCNTTYFNTAVTAYGTTFDTITGTLPSASLPAQ